MTRDGRDTLIESLAHQEGVRNTYKICAYDGTLVALHVRIQSPSQKKRFVWQQPGGSSGLHGRPVSELPLYRTERIPTYTPGSLVVIAEGEKDTDALLTRGFRALGSVTGSATCHADPVLATLAGFEVAVWPDNDEVGREHAGATLAALARIRGTADGLFLVDTAALGMTGKGDGADDWRPTDALDELYDALQPYTPPPPPPPEPPLEPDETPKPAPTRTMVKGGKNRRGLLAALRHMAVDLRYNKRSARLEFLNASDDFPKWTNSDDMIRAALRERVSEEFLYTAKEGPVPLTISKDRFGDLIEALLDSRRVDPFKAWLDNLPKWDGEKRLDFWLYGCFKIGDISSDLLRWASYSVLMGAVARTYEPGEKHDEMVILVGPQGLGKSTVWAWLLPPSTRRQWFSDALKFHADVKAQVEALQGRVIVEAAEMSGSTRTEVESIKAFLARQDDGAVRLTYRRDPIDLPRRCVIVGSTNDPRCLPNDPSGNRRFVPVPVSAGNPREIRKFMNQWREQLWAEALHRARVLKEPAWLPDELKAQQAILNERYRATDEIAEDVVQEYLQGYPGPVTIRQIADGIKWDSGGRSAYRITNVLKQLGYSHSPVQTRQADGGRGRFWFPPSGTLLDQPVPKGNSNE